MSKRRIRKYNEMNWVIESWTPPAVITFGKNKGMMSQGSWVVEGYYGRLEDIPSGLMKKIIGKTGKVYPDYESLMQAVEEAKKEALAIIKEFIGENKK